MTVKELEPRIEDTGYLSRTNDLLEENNDVLKANMENTLWIFNTLVFIAVLLSLILLSIVFQIEL